jgi:CubicO group peptidase (beta-lactamase class C family)
VYWGGLAGTKWFFSPREDLAAVLMTQRYMGSELPFWPDFMRALRQDLRR